MNPNLDHVDNMHNITDDLFFAPKTCYILDFVCKHKYLLVCKQVLHD